MGERYRIPAATHRTEEEIKRSRFITTIGHASTVAAARGFIADVSHEFADASHNCWAYVIGPPGSTRQIGMSDAGEPHGSAGRPMLTVLQHAGIGDIVAVVTRYFGGTLLGVGGLVRAYSGGVQLALTTLPTTERIDYALLSVVLDYPAVTPVLRLLSDFAAEIQDQAYAADVTFQLRLPVENLEALMTRLNEATNGQVLFEVETPSSIAA